MIAGVCLAYMSHLDFLLGWDVETTGDRGRLPAGLVHMEANLLSFFCHLFLINFRHRFGLVMSSVIVDKGFMSSCLMCSLPDSQTEMLRFAAETGRHILDPPP